MDMLFLYITAAYAICHLGNVPSILHPCESPIFVTVHYKLWDYYCYCQNRWAFCSIAFNCFITEERTFQCVHL